jgi:hypothetical protein
MEYSLVTDLKYKLDANILVIQLILRTDKTAFMNIKLDDFINQLKERIENPYTINQGNASLCGPAAVMFCWLSKRPDLYTQYVISMYEKGSGKMGSLAITPGDDCKNYDPVTTPDVDWIALAALRDSENIFLDYDDEGDQLSGITMPGEVEKWLKNIGFHVVENNTALVFGEGYEVLRQAAGHFKEGRSVCLFVNARFLHGDGLNLTADHWIVMTSEPIIDGNNISSLPSGEGLFDKKIDFNVFTWGPKYSGRISQWQSITLNSFLDCFYGYIASEYDRNSRFENNIKMLSDQDIKLSY